MITHSFGNHKTKSRLLICEDKVSKSRLHSIEGSHWLDLPEDHDVITAEALTLQSG